MKVLDTSVAIDHLRGKPAATSLLRELIIEDEILLASELTTNVRHFPMIDGLNPAYPD